MAKLGRGVAIIYVCGNMMYIVRRGASVVVVVRREQEAVE